MGQLFLLQESEPAHFTLDMELVRQQAEKYAAENPPTYETISFDGVKEKTVEAFIAGVKAMYECGRMPILKITGDETELKQME